MVVLAPANAKPLRCIGFLKNLDFVNAELVPGDWDSDELAPEEGSSGSKSHGLPGAKCKVRADQTAHACWPLVHRANWVASPNL